MNVEPIRELIEILRQRQADGARKIEELLELERRVNAGGIPDELQPIAPPAATAAMVNLLVRKRKAYFSAKCKQAHDRRRRVLTILSDGRPRMPTDLVREFSDGSAMEEQTAWNAVNNDLHWLVLHGLAGRVTGGWLATEAGLKWMKEAA